MIDWEHEYNRLKEWVLNLAPHCTNCYSNDCNDCPIYHGSNEGINWVCDPNELPEIEN